MGNGKNNSPDFDIRRDFEQGKGYASYGGSEGADDNYGSQNENSDRTGESAWSASEKNYEDRSKVTEPRGNVSVDEKIKEDVWERLNEDQSVDASSIEVLVKECKVILSGIISDKDVSNRAEDIAASVSGVTDVENRLQVKTVLGNEPTPPGGNENIGNKTSIGSNAVPSPGGGTPR